jgi:aspartate aminotransferase-like enzyme
MLRVGPYVFKRAETDDEFDQIHRLNYRTFVSEIPQHADPGNGRLIDKFHDKNAYFIVLCEGRVVGMVSGHDQPPFSVADRLSDTTLLTQPGTRPLEVRLLAIEPDRRNSTVFFGLMWSLYDHAVEHGYTHLFISGIVERLPLYRRLGLEPIGAAIGHGKASFVPMMLTVGRLPERVQRTKHQWESHMTKVVEPVCLLPGPVAIAPAVRDAFHQPPIYHRGPEFIARFAQVRRTLGDLVGGRDVALLNGSGTLGNEAVAALLAADKQCDEGLLLVNGEFGQRLAKQALRFGLRPRVLAWPWGQPWDLDDVETALADAPPGCWVWGVHQESSTGVLNDLPGLARVAKKHGARVCADCISSLGAVPLDLQGVYLATGASGKSLGAFAGVAMVFADGAALSRVDLDRVPSYFDIPTSLATPGPRYTFPSPTLAALETALDAYANPERAQATYARYAALGQFVRRRLRAVRVEPLAADTCASPVVTTFAPPAEEPSAEFVTRCATWGYAIGGQSGYLAERRLVQVATMGAVGEEELGGFFERFQRWLTPRGVKVGRDGESSERSAGHRLIKS